MNSLPGGGYVANHDPLREVNATGPPARVDDPADSLERQLARFVSGHVCLLGIGNRFWRDDGVGSYLAEMLDDDEGFPVIDAGFIPENHLEKVVRTNPDAILVVDAADFGGEPGEVRLLYPEHVAYTGVSTHAGSLRMLAEYLGARTGARIALLAIQPADTSAGGGLSPEVSASFRVLMELLPTLQEGHRHSLR